MNILLPVDGSEAALDAVHHALALVRQGLSARCVLANVQEAPHLYEVVLAPDVEVLTQASQAAGEHALTQARVLLNAAGVPFDCEIGHGDPGHVLCDIAERLGCDLVIVSSQGEGLLSGNRLGSVCQWLLHHAPVPVTVVHHSEPDEAMDTDGADSADTDTGP